MMRTFLTNGLLILLTFCVLPTIIIAATKKDKPLTRVELREKYGQTNTTFNDGKSCYRDCNEISMTCYYEFAVEYYETMSGLCGNCSNGILRDCFNTGCIPGNGVPRNIMSVNRKLPGTPIKVCKNDRVIVDVTNHMHGSEVTIHWHGPHQKETPWMDGVPMVTQCPISSGNTFRYAFNARESGTQYYHAHTGLHRTNGCVGLLNVREQNDSNVEFYDYDLSEHSILLSDWNNYLAESKSMDLKTEPAHPESILINGRGSYYDETSDSYTYAPMEVFYVERGKRHRFRLDNAASQYCAFEFCIKDHNLTVIATDGYPVEPLTVDCIISSAGERFDVVMHASDNPDMSETLISVRALGWCEKTKLQEFARIIFVDNFKQHIRKYEDHEPLKNRPRYNSHNDFSKITLNHPHTNCTDPNSISFCITALHSKHVKYPIGDDLRNEPVEKVIPLNFRFIYGDMRQETFNEFSMVALISNISSSEKSVPLLTQDEPDSETDFCNSDNLPSHCDTESVCHCSHLIELEVCKVYEFFIKDGGQIHGNESHPVHLHGYAFQVVEMAFPDADGNPINPTMPSGNSTDPMKTLVIKDTLTVPSGGYARIRFRACNPGYWFFHCHFEFHMHLGMRAIVKVGNKSDMVPPPPNFPTCGNYLPAIY